MNSPITLDDVIEAFIMESDQEAETFARYFLDYPQFSTELTELAADIFFGTPVAKLSQIDRAWIDSAWEKYRTS